MNRFRRRTSRWGCWLRAQTAWCLLIAAGCPAGDAGVVVDDATEADRWLGTDRAGTFDAHIAAVESVAALAADGFTRLGTTWEQQRDAVERMYLGARTSDDVFYALSALRNSLHDGHARLAIDGLLPRQAATVVEVPLSLRVEYEGAEARYVVREGGDLPPGSAIISVGGVAIAELERGHLMWFDGGNSPEALRDDLARWIGRRDPLQAPAPQVGDDVDVVARTPDGVVQRATLTFTAHSGGGDGCPPYADPCVVDVDGDYSAAPDFEGLGFCIYGTNDPTTRVVRYHSLMTPETLDRVERECLTRKLPHLSYALTLDEADARGPRGLLQRDQEALLDHLARHGVQRVLFDVRENRGGDFDPTFFGAFTGGAYAQPRKSFVYAPLFQQTPERIVDANIYVALLDGQPIDDGAARIEAFLRTNPGTPRSPPIPFYCQSTSCADGEETLTSQSNIVFDAAVLTGPRCFSACDDFVAIMHDNGIASTIGLPTGAGDAPYSFDVTLPLHNEPAAMLRVTVGVSFHPGSDDTPLEAHPVVVDVPLPPTAANRHDYLNTAIARAPW